MIDGLIDGPPGGGQGPKCIPSAPASPDAAGILRIHRLALVTAKRLSELVEVLHAPACSPLPWRVRIDEGKLAGRLLRLARTPNLGEADKEPLRFSVAADLFIN